jgi:hypothetical protein
MKIDLTDTTFLIPVYHDSHDRDENLTLAIKQLKQDFNTKIIVGENESSSFSHLGDKYMRFNYKEFHRTRLLNQMAYKATTPIVVNFDSDVLIPPLQLLEAVRKVRSGYDVVYPYDGRFARVPRTHYKDLNELRDVGILGGKYFAGTGPKDELSVGGAIVFNKDSFFRGGGENERFLSYGPEDQERYYRFTTLGYNVDRVKGILYHIDHKITINSSMQHKNYPANQKEWEKVKKMDKYQLLDYVDTWDFTSNYEETYHSDIKDTSSAKEVYNYLETLIDFKSVVDVGCGDGNWHDPRYRYTGIDFNVYPDVPDYVDFDIRKRLPDIGRYDLAISLEVFEHLPAEEHLIDNLCQLSDQILFSAAIPGQDGENHINCQWQSYWAEKFKEKGYYPYYKDIRTSLWNNKKIAPWYRQNMVLYTKNGPTREYQLDMVHPEMYLNVLI